MKTKSEPGDWQIDDGLVVQISGKKIAWAGVALAGMTLVALALLAGSLIACLAGSKTDPVKNVTPHVLLNGLKWGMCVGGFFTLAWVSFFGLNAALAYVARERFVVGKTALQHVLRKSVILHLPFDNMKDVSLGSHLLHVPGAEEPTVVPHIAIHVRDRTDPETLLNGDLAKTNRKDHNCDVLITDKYDLSLKNFYKKISLKWQEANRKRLARETGDAETTP